jgi:hypothetical protein
MCELACLASIISQSCIHVYLRNACACNRCAGGVMLLEVERAQPEDQEANKELEA